MLHRLKWIADLCWYCSGCIKTKVLTAIESPYTDIFAPDYRREKRRLQIELLRVQWRWVQEGSRMAVVFERRAAMAEGSRLKRYIKHLMPARAVALGKFC